MAGITAATDVRVGNDFQCAVVAGEPQCWGSNNFQFQLGRGTGAIGTPAPLDPKLPAGTLNDLQLWNQTSCASASTGAYCWGPDEGGIDTPSGAHGLIAAGDVTTLGIGEDHHCWLVGGAVHCAGATTWEQLGGGSATTPVPGLASGFGARRRLPAQLRARLRGVKCWGQNLSGQASGASSGAFSVASPATVTPLGSGVLELAVGGHHGCARTAAGVSCWGGGFQVGSDLPTSRQGPIVVSGLPANVVKVGAGLSQSYGLTADGRLFVWGYNYRHQFGFGNEQYVVSPDLVLGLGAWCHRARRRRCTRPCRPSS